MIIAIEGYNLPGRVCGPYRDVHVALQVGKLHDHLVPGDADVAEWRTEVGVVHTDDGLDFRGPAVHGKRGDRFLYLAWGGYEGDTFTMFRRAKLMLGRVDRAVVTPAESAGELVARVDLTDDRGMPRCARVDPPAIEWHNRGA